MDQQPHHEYPDPACVCHVIPGSVVIVCVHGEIDWDTAPTLTACLDEQLDPTLPAVGVEVALTHVTFFGARGITALLVAAHTARQRAIDFGITGCSARLLRLFDLVGVREELTGSGWARTG